ncbi:MAG: hypothetical protein ACKPJD_07075, partial [Planctomycetaceae bacterium]
MDAAGTNSESGNNGGGISEADGGMLLPQRPELLQTGFNPALSRVPAPDTICSTLDLPLDFVPSWTPRRIPLKCIGLTLPEGVEFLPPALPKPALPVDARKAAAKSA